MDREADIALLLSVVPDLVLFCTRAGLNDALDDVVPESVLPHRGFPHSHWPCDRVGFGSQSSRRLCLANRCGYRKRYGGLKFQLRAIQEPLQKQPPGPEGSLQKPDTAPSTPEPFNLKPRGQHDLQERRAGAPCRGREEGRHQCRAVLVKLSCYRSARLGQSAPKC